MRSIVAVILAGTLLSSAQTPNLAPRRPAKRSGMAAENLLGWRLGVRSTAFGRLTFLEAAAKADAAGFGYIEGSSVNLDYNLSSDELSKVKARLGELQLRMPAYRIETVPSDTASRQKLFEFGKALGVDTMIVSSKQSTTDLDKLANEFGMKISAAVDLGSRTTAPKETLIAAHLSGSGMAQFLLDLSRLQPPEAPAWPMKCGDCGTPKPTVKPLFFTVEPTAIQAYEKAVAPAMGWRVDEISRKTPITTADKIPANEKEQIDAAVPRQALVKPKRARKLLILDVCPAGGFYHTTIAHGNLMLQLIGKYTGAYEAVFDNDLDNLKYPKIKQYDAVFLNSVVGPVFADPEVISGLTRYVREGGGVAGLHGSTFASQDVAEFGDLMGAQAGPHKYNGEPGTLKIDDPNSPLTKHFGGRGFEMMDEFYHFPPTGPYTREKLHILLSVDAEKTDLRQWQIRPDKDYGMVWIKSYGKGRVFNSVLGHRPEFYSNPDLVKLMLGGIQFVLGDLEADTTPSAKFRARR